LGVAETAREQVEAEAEELETLEKTLEKQLERKEQAKSDPSPSSRPVEHEELVVDPGELKRRQFQAERIRALADAGPGFPEFGPAGPPVDAAMADAAGVAIPRPKQLPTEMDLTEAVHLIQIHERARQSRRDAFNSKFRVHFGVDGVPFAQISLFG